MFIFSRRLEDLRVQATDGELGKVKDIYFDEDSWVVRYLVVDTQKWLPGRKVLISPIILDKVDPEEEKMNILETKEKIKDSPSIDVHQPVSRKQESMLHTYYGWPHYWGYNENFHIWGPYSTPFELLKSRAPEEDIQPVDENNEEEKLRSVNEIKGDFTGYSIQARDGEIGHVNDFVIDDSNWKLRYFIVETRNWLVGKFVVLSTDWIENISWSDKKVFLDLTKEEIKNGPFFDLNETFTREDEKRLYESYNKTPYF